MRVFISYTHESDEHRDRVLALSQRLRADGIETVLDRYVNGTPPQGWPRWMLDELDAADYVLVVCTETYYRRFRGHHQEETGKGVDWEGALITQESYDTRDTSRFVPVLFPDSETRHIPEPLRRATSYTISSAAGYDRLYAFLLGQGGVSPHPIGEVRMQPPVSVAPLVFTEESTTNPPEEAPPEPQKSPKAKRLKKFLIPIGLVAVCILLTTPIWIRDYGPLRNVDKTEENVTSVKVTIDLITDVTILGIDKLDDRIKDPKLVITTSKLQFERELLAGIIDKVSSPQVAVLEFRDPTPIGGASPAIGAPLSALITDVQFDVYIDVVALPVGSVIKGGKLEMIVNDSKTWTWRIDRKEIKMLSDRAGNYVALAVSGPPDEDKVK